MSKHKRLTLRELRGERTLREISEGTGVPISTYVALEKGWGMGYSPSLKHKISDFYGANFFITFPEERLRLGPIMKPEVRRLMLAEYIPELRFQDEGAITAILNAATLDELDTIFHSGVDDDEVLGALAVLAKKYDLPAPQVK